VLQVGDVGGRIWAGKRDEIEVAKKELIEGLKELENVLGDKPYFGGETFGFVDIALIPFYSWFYTYEQLGNFKVEAECAKLIAWAKRCKERESVSKSVADEKEAYEYVVNYRKRFQLD
jgi:glutathione S-transferase